MTIVREFFIMKFYGNKKQNKLFTTIVKVFPMNNFMKKKRNKNQSCKS